MQGWAEFKSEQYPNQYLIHRNKYPVPQTMFVAMIEMCKVAFTVVARSRPAFSRDNLRASLPYIVPSLIYALQGGNSIECNIALTLSMVHLGQPISEYMKIVDSLLCVRLFSCV